ncbi:MAG: TonB-dependent receptor [Bryobacteraceae bacterium]
MRLSATIVLACAVLRAQTNTGSITGLVTDGAGASVPGAKVVIRELGTNATVNTVTTGAGSYTAPSLPVGSYAVTVSAAGFKRGSATGLEVRATQTTTQNFALQVGEVTESVTVSADSSLVNPNSSAVTTSIGEKMLDDIPFMDRSTLSVVLLAPGAQGDPQYNGGVQSDLPGVFTQAVAPGATISVGGGIPGGGSTLVDGSDVTAAGNGRMITTFSRDQVSEVSVQANGIPAQYGRTTSAIINQATRSGGNRLRGNLSWSHLDPYLQTQALGAAFPPTQHYDQAAVAVGGPVVIPKIYNGRDKTFFWSTFEPQRLKMFFGATRSRLPTADELQGKFNNSYDLLDPVLRQQNIDAAISSQIRSNSLRYHYPLNEQGFPNGELLPTAARPVIPNNDLSATLARNPMAQKILRTLFPFTPGQPTAFIRWLRPDGNTDIDGNNAIWARGVNTIDNRYSFKIDQLLGEKSRLAFRYAYSPITGTRFDWAGYADPGDSIAQDQFRSRNMSLIHTHSFSPTVFNEFRVSYSRGNSLRDANEAALSKDWAKELGLVPAISGRGFPSIITRGFNAQGSFNGTSLDVNLGVGNDLSVVRGRHTFKFGGEHRRVQLNRHDYGGQNGGTYSFAGQITPNTGSVNTLIDQIGGLITGSVNTFVYRTVPTVAYYRWRYAAAYAQDDFKLTSRLTLNLGVRWDMETPRTEKYDRQGAFVPDLKGTIDGKAVAGGFAFSGTNGLPRSLWPVNYRGWQPRIGLAWAARPWMTWRASYNLIKTPLTGVGADVDPDFNISSDSVSSPARTGGVAPGPVNLISNPIGPLTAPRLVGRDPVFFMNNVNQFTFYAIPQSDLVPNVQKWHLGTQMVVRRDLVISIGYDGTKGTHLFTRGYRLNSVDPARVIPLVAAGADFQSTSEANNPIGIRNSDASLIRGTILDAMRPFPQWFNRNITTRYDRSGNSIYHGLGVGFQKRYAKGVTVQGAYTWSKSIDDEVSNYQGSGASDIFGAIPYQSVNRRGERSLSVFDVPHKFNTAASWQIPFARKRIWGDWNLSGLFMRSAGYPASAIAGNNGWFQSIGGGNALDGFTLRPDRVLGVPVINPVWRDSPFTQPYLNPAAFAIPGSDGQPALGNTPRTLPDARSPSTTSFDASLFKNFRLGRDASRRLQLRVDVINVANHPNFFINPNSSRTLGAFNFTATTRTFTPSNRFQALDPNNTGQFGNYAGRSFRMSARVYF